MSKRIGVRYLGKLTEVADSDELFDSPLHPYTRALHSADLPAQRIGLALGTGLGDPDGRPHPLTQAVVEALGVTGPCLTVCTACSSSTNAIGLARQLLLSGAADAVLAGGVDVLAPLVFAGFHGLEVLSASKWGRK